MILFFFILFCAFAMMELVSYLAHRYVYHGLLWVFHKSHHTSRTGPFEWNDVFPLFFASVSILVIWYAVGDPGRRNLLALALGVTLYGILYFLIHDIYVHQRVAGVVFRVRYLRRVKRAHMIHHTYGKEPYGLLVFPLRDMAGMKSDPAHSSDSPS